VLAASYIQLGAPPRRDGLRHFRPSLPTAVVPDRHHFSTSAVHYGVTGRRENHIDLPNVLFSHHALDTVPPPLLFGELKMGSIAVEAWSHRATYILGVALQRSHVCRPYGLGYLKLWERWRSFAVRVQMGNCTPLRFSTPYICVWNWGASQVYLTPCWNGTYAQRHTWCILVMGLEIYLYRHHASCGVHHSLDDLLDSANLFSHSHRSSEAAHWTRSTPYIFPRSKIVGRPSQRAASAIWPA